VNRSNNADALATEFSPLSVSTVPTLVDDDWQPLMAAIPDVRQATTVPRPIEIDIVQKQVRLFLPGFEKKQVKLIQSGPEITIEAGDQRRNIFLPPQLQGRAVTGAKFQNQFLTISF
ncbi:MAG: ArsA family ATPase, partial [Geitlerinemataceae cyanobacterium]